MRDIILTHQPALEKTCLLVEKEFGNHFQNFCIGEVLPRIIEARGVDYRDVGTGNVVLETNGADFTGLGIHAMADLDAVAPGQELD